MFRFLVVLCAAALLVIPASSRADDGKDETVRLVIECSPETADAIQHLLKGLPAKVYRAEPVGSATDKPRVAPKPRGKPVGVVSAVPVWHAVMQAAKDLDLSVHKMTVNPRSMRVTIIAGGEETLTAYYKALGVQPALRERARNSKSFVEPGAVQKVEGGVKGDFTVVFGERPSSPRGRTTQGGIDLVRIKKAADASNLRLFRAGGERRDRNRARAVTTIYSEYVFEETTLPNLLRFLSAIEQPAGLVATEVRWQLRPDKLRPNGEPLIQKPAVKLAQWIAD